MTYRVELDLGAAVQFHSLPRRAQDELFIRAAELSSAPWDGARVLAPGEDSAFREATFDHGQGLIYLFVNEAEERIRIYNVLWVSRIDTSD